MFYSVLLFCCFCSTDQPNLRSTVVESLFLPLPMWSNGNTVIIIKIEKKNPETFNLEWCEDQPSPLKKP